MTIYFSLLVALIGVVIYIVAEKPKIVEIGRLAYGVGLLTFLLLSAHSSMTLLR